MDVMKMNPIATRIAARLSMWILCGCAAAVAAGTAFGQAFPTKPVHLVTAEVGGGAAVIARLLAQGLSVNLGYQVVVENQGGANGIIAAQSVIKAPADGHTFLFYSSNIWLLPFLQSNAPFDPVRDLAPVMLVDRSPAILVVHPALPVRSVKQLIALAKSRPGELNYGAGSAGAPPHLAAELFKTMAGVNIVRINYRGTGPGVTALIGGQVQLMFAAGSAVGGHIQSGRLRALAVTSARPSPLAPDLPTVAATLPGYEAESTHGVLVRAGTADAIVGRLNQEIARILANSDFQAKLSAIGVETVGGSPARFGEIIQADMAKWGKLIREGGVRSE
jgi:tripartite-type tricarboxylate transporter receptor subunit TctC